MRFQQVLEFRMVDAEHDVAVHLDKAPVAVIGKTRIAAGRCQTFHTLVVETEVQHRIHHARHGNTRAGAHRNQKRVRPVAKRSTHSLLDMRHARRDRGLEIIRIALAVLVVMGADLRRDRKPRRNRQTDARHLG